MARPKKYHVLLSDDDVKRLRGLIRKKGTAPTTANRCRVLLALDENHPPARSYDHCVDSYGVSRATVSTIARKFGEGGVDAALARKRSPNSDNARRKVDGRAEARIVEVACGPAPEGRARWTVRLLESELKVVLDEPVSRETIRRTLKKTGSGPTAATTGASPAGGTRSS